jgi:hypothetical protein
VCATLQLAMTSAVLHNIPLGNLMHREQRFCPQCHALLYDDAILEGQLDMPPGESIVECVSCYWHGMFAALERAIPVPRSGSYIPDYQI